MINFSNFCFLVCHHATINTAANKILILIYQISGQNNFKYIFLKYIRLNANYDIYFDRKLYNII